MIKRILDDPVRRKKLYILFKYTIYLLLLWDTAVFFHDDWLASSHTFRGGINLGNLMDAFTASIDTLNWVVLLLLLEFETGILSDKSLEKKGVRWSLRTAELLCYALVIYAFQGYLAKMMLFYNVTPLQLKDVCNLVDGQLFRVNRLDEYVRLTAENCQSLQGLALFKINGQNMIADAATLTLTRELAWIDVVNDAAWIGVVLILEIDVWVQLKGLLMKISKLIKVILYSTLLACALYWGWLSSFMDFWDAFLWLLSFAFIEMNLFVWPEETPEQVNQDQMPITTPQ